MPSSVRNIQIAKLCLDYSFERNLIKIKVLIGSVIVIIGKEFFGQWLHYVANIQTHSNSNVISSLALPVHRLYC